ncbi:TaqI-like C-terminal specificity domain-containing protein [Chryseobacterium sp. Marseille-Q8038]
MWIINSHNGIKEKGIRPVDIEKYPAIKKHLDEFYPQLEKRSDRGDTPYNLRNCTYLDDFFIPKIIYPEITKFLNFYYDESNFLINNKCFILTGQFIFFLISFLNSSLFKYCFIDNFPELLGGTRELRKVFLERIPIIQINHEIENEFKILVMNLQYLKVNNRSTIDIEKQIDQIIFNLYELSDDERKEIGFIEIQ